MSGQVPSRSISLAFHVHAGAGGFPVACLTSGLRCLLVSSLWWHHTQPHRAHSSLSLSRRRREGARPEVVCHPASVHSSEGAGCGHGGSEQSVLCVQREPLAGCGVLPLQPWQSPSALLTVLRSPGLLLPSWWTGRETGNLRRDQDKIELPGMSLPSGPHFLHPPPPMRISYSKSNKGSIH